MDSGDKIELIVLCIYACILIGLVLGTRYIMSDAKSSMKKPFHRPEVPDTWEFGYYLRAVAPDGTSMDLGPFVSDDPKKDTYTDPKIAHKIAFWANRLNDENMIYTPIQKERL